jgi:oligopeptide transport system ATP-binding protein
MIGLYVPQLLVKISSLSMILLDIKHLNIIFPTEAGVARAVEDLSFSINKGEVLGLVGESGCGKSVTALSLLRLLPTPGKIVSGEILYEGIDLVKLSENEVRKYRGNRIALIPQDPMTSLNPVYTVGFQVVEAIQVHQKISQSEARKNTIELFELVRIPQAKDRINEYPHQFSGGMRQRVMIAMALSCQPELLIADEPTTALDVTVQAQILDLLRSIQKEKHMSILLITHDLGVVAEMCDQVAVMYAGSIVEQANVQELFRNPLHPYTVGLMNCLPKPGTTRLVPIEGQPPDLVHLPTGCRFADRCVLVEPRSREAVPLFEEKTPGHFVRCVIVGTKTPVLTKNA